MAKGVVAVGPTAIGVVAVGMRAYGLMPVGLVAIGGLPVGLAAVGLEAVGLLSVGVEAVGLVALALHHAVGLLALAMSKAVGLSAFAPQPIGVLPVPIGLALAPLACAVAAGMIALVAVLSARARQVAASERSKPPFTERLKRAAAAALVVFLLVTLAATVVMFLLPESYVGAARVKVNREAIVDLTSGQPNYDPYFIQTEFEVIQSRLLLQRVITNLDLCEVWGRKFNAGQRLSEDDAFALLRNSLTLRLVRGTSLIEIQAYSDDPPEAAKLANGVAEAYRDFRLEQRRTRSSTGARQLENQLTEQQAKVKLVQAELESLRTKLGVIKEASTNSAGGGLTPIQKLQRLEAMQVAATGEASGKQTLHDQLRSKTTAELRTILPAALISLSQPDSMLNDLLGQLSGAQRRLAKLQSDSGPQHPEVLQVQAQLRELDSKVDERIKGILTGFENAAIASRAQADSLAQQIAMAKQREIEQAGKERPYWEKKREVDELVRFQNILQLKLAAEKADLTLPSEPPVEIVDRAVPALHPVRPNKPLNIFLGAVAGGVLGLIAGGFVLLMSFPTPGRVIYTALAVLLIPAALILAAVAGPNSAKQTSMPPNAPLPAPAKLPGPTNSTALKPIPPEVFERWAATQAWFRDAEKQLKPNDPAAYEALDREYQARTLAIKELIRGTVLEPFSQQQEAAAERFRAATATHDEAAAKAAADEVNRLRLQIEQLLRPQPAAGASLTNEALAPR